MKILNKKRHIFNGQILYVVLYLNENSSSKNTVVFLMIAITLLLIKIIFEFLWTLSVMRILMQDLGFSINCYEKNIKRVYLSFLSILFCVIINEK